MGTMMDFLKHEGTTDRERDRLKMSVKTPASWKAHALSTRPGILSGPMALRMFTRLKDRVTSTTESVSGLTSSAAALFDYYNCITPLTKNTLILKWKKLNLGKIQILNRHHRADFN